MKIRIIGSGNIGSSFARILGKKHHISLYDKHKEKAEKVAHDYHLTCCQKPFENLDRETVLILAIKPQDLPSFASIAKEMPSAKLLISCLAGVNLSALQKEFPHLPLIRMMPNLAIREGLGIMACTATKNASSYQDEISDAFSSLGLVTWICEENFDAFTSLIGSGPGFMCAMVEAMVDAGVAMGIAANDSLVLVKQMIRGSLSLLEENSPASIRLQITSPGGTTSAGMRIFEEKGVRSGIIETFLGAQAKAKELVSDCIKIADKTNGLKN